MMDRRYLRQLVVPEIGAGGRARLEQAAVTVIGAGGLGATVLLCLSGLGVGRLCIVDDDVVSLSNLDRQFLYEEADVGRAKVFAARDSIQRRNGMVKTEAIQARVTEENVSKLVSRSDLIILAVDNDEARQVVNHICCQWEQPLVNGGVKGMCGSVQLVVPGETACLVCAGGIALGKGAAVPSPPPVVAWTASLMAQAGMLWLLGRAENLKNTLLYLDGNCFIQERIPLRRAERCPACGGTAKV